MLIKKLILDSFTDFFNDNELNLNFYRFLDEKLMILA
jgi:hypothetical protein